MDNQYIFKKLLDEISQKIDNDEIIYDTNAHQTSLKYLFDNDKKLFKEKFLKYIESFLLTKLLRLDLKNINDANDIDINVDDNSFITYEQCPICGELTEIYFDGKKIYDKVVCFDVESNYKKHHSEILPCFTEPPSFSVDINIPSGKLLLADWPLYGQEIINIKDENVNCLKGRYMQSQNYAQKNIMHFYVGNTCPKVLQKDNEIIIGKHGSHEDEDGYDVEVPIDENFEYKGSICTDLWWTTGIDLDLYNKLLEQNVTDEFDTDKIQRFIKEDAVIIDLEPGIYTCTTFFETLDDYHCGPQIYIKIEPKGE